MINSFRLLIILLFFSACSGYRLVYRKNPLGMYGISSVSVPMFFNKSNLANTSPVFTEEFYKYLSSFEDLTVYPGNNEKSDAVLLGIIDSPKSIKDTITVTDTKFASTLVDKADIGLRRDFFTPTQNRVNLVLKLILIKKPSQQEIEVLHGNLPKGSIIHPKVIFNEEIPLSIIFDREIKSFNTAEREGVTNFTNNQGNLNKVIEDLAVQGKDVFRDLIIYAF